ncbi:alpha/beta fold hydrolase [Paenarthrobacter nitroguajacolicus]|uniref:alpha/beta fold hydrolase n=1 Tax=Paenarthrobacter nitroguajacolicus TaxID=211146 RepID=UPI003D208BE0
MTTPNQSLPRGSRPVFLLHGWSGSARTTWAPFHWNEELRNRGFNPHAVDLLGHGNAAAPHDPTAYADIASHTARAFEGHERVDVISFSMGAKITLALAARMPHRFRRIVLSGVGENVFRPERVGMVADSMEHGLSDAVPARVRDLAAMAFASGNDVLALAACMRRESTPITRDEVAAIEIPVLIAVGDQDSIAGDPLPLAAALPNATVIRLPGIDHVGTPYARDFRSAAIEFLAQDEEET